MTVIINSRGQVLSAQVLESSGHIDLDRRAQAIVMSSGPFAAFTPALLAKADQLALVSRFSFKENGVLDAEQR
jgi:protein TonB